MSRTVCHRISVTVAGTPAIALRFLATPEEAGLLGSRIRAQVDPAEVGVEITVEDDAATSAAGMVDALLASLPSADVSLGESVGRDQLVNVAGKLDFCVAMAGDVLAGEVRDQAPRLGEVLVRFQRVGAGADAGAQSDGLDTCRVVMTDPAADQDTDALVGLFTRALGDVLVTHGHATRLSVTQRRAADLVGSADDAVAALLRALHAAGLPMQAELIQAAFPEGEAAASDGDALAA